MARTGDVDRSPRITALSSARCFQVAGWTDAYPDAAVRIQERCTNAAVRTLVGNWVHSFPDDAYPGPNLDWLREMVRFFDRYLKGVDNGWEDEPALVWYEREYADPEPFPGSWPGRWRAAAAFPVPGTVARELPLGPGTLGPAPDADRVDPLPHRATVGTAGALSWGAGGAPERPRPRPAPGRASRADLHVATPLAEGLSVIGRPEAMLHLTASMPVATCVVRLSDVSPEGVSSLVATGVLNLTHRLSDVDPAPMPARARATEEVRIPLRVSGYRFTPGHRIRLTVLTSYWPVLWPSPFRGEIRVHHGPGAPSRLILPVLPDEVATPAVPSFGTSPLMRDVGRYEEDVPEWRIEEDVLRGTVAVTIFDGGGSTQEDGSRLYSSERLVLTASDADPAHARLESDVSIAGRGSVRMRTSPPGG